MKKGLSVLLIFLLVSLVKISAQGQNIEKLNAYKIVFFTKRLGLSSAEAEKFWPVYNEYQDQKARIQFEKTMVIRKFDQSANTLSDSQLSEMGDKLAATIVQESSLAVTFHNKLKEIFPPAKVIRFYQAENQYKVQLLNELQGRRQQRLNPGNDL